ncbi:response regulator transcription factor [Streptomyces sp. NPDC002623]
MTVRVLLADEQALIRTGFRALIESEPDLEVAGEAATGQEAVMLARSSRADVVLMNIRMPGTDGLAATRAISADEDLAGSHYLATPDLTGISAPEFRLLTEREREVFGLVATGLSNDLIAERLRISRSTAKTHVNHIMTKLGVRGRAQLVAIAYQTGFVQNPDPDSSPGMNA